MKFYPHQDRALDETEPYNRTGFVPVKGYEGLYSISSNGDVISMYSAITLKPCERNGYLYVNLYRDKKPKKHYIHRLVAEAFIPNPDGLPEVNHIDSDKKNNQFINLEWCDRSQNVKHTYTVGGRSSNRETHLGNNYRGVSVRILDGGEEVTFPNMKAGSLYLGKNKHYISEKFRKRRTTQIVIDGKRVIINE